MSPKLRDILLEGGAPTDEKGEWNGQQGEMASQPEHLVSGGTTAVTSGSIGPEPRQT